MCTIVYRSFLFRILAVTQETFIELLLYGMASASDITFVFCLFLFSPYFDQYQMPSICMFSGRYDNVLDIVHRLMLVHNFGGYSVDIQSHATRAQCVCSEAENSAIEKAVSASAFLFFRRTVEICFVEHCVQHGVCIEVCIGCVYV